MSLPSAERSAGGTRAQLVDAPVRERDAAVPAERLDDVQVVELHRIERLRVGRADVIALEEALDEDLPVGRDLELGASPTSRVARRDQRRQRRRVDAPASGGASCVTNTMPLPLDGLDRHESARALVEAGEAVLVRHVAEARRRGRRSSRGSGRRTPSRSPRRRRAACRGGGRRCGRRAPGRRCRAPRGAACRRRRARRRSRRSGSAADGQNGVGYRRRTSVAARPRSAPRER